MKVVRTLVIYCSILLVLFILVAVLVSKNIDNKKYTYYVDEHFGISHHCYTKHNNYCIINNEIIEVYEYYMEE